MALQENCCYLTQIKDKISKFYKDDILLLDQMLVLEKDVVTFNNENFTVLIEQDTLTITDKKTQEMCKVFINDNSTDVLLSVIPKCKVNSYKIKIDNLTIDRHQVKYKYRIVNREEKYKLVGCNLKKYKVYTKDFKFIYEANYNTDLRFVFYDDLANTSIVKTISFRKNMIDYCWIKLIHQNGYEVKTNINVNYSQSQIVRINYTRCLKNKEVFSLLFDPSYKEDRLSLIYIRDLEKIPGSSVLRITHDEYIDERCDCADDCDCNKIVKIQYSLKFLEEDKQLITTLDGLYNFLKKQLSSKFL